MIAVLSTEEMRKTDETTINQFKIPGIVLMERAAQGCVDALLESMQTSHEQQVYVFAGSGNNGGDGLAIARYLWEAGFFVTVFSFIKPDAYKGDALINANILVQLGVPWYQITEKNQITQLPPADIVIDAMLGTGLKGTPDGLIKDCIDLINNSPSFVLSVDIPSGINGNFPKPAGAAVKADLTVTMDSIKPAHLFYPARYFTGELHVVNIGVPDAVRKIVKPFTYLIEQKDIHLPLREEHAHKYKFGKVLIIGGSYGLSGAPVMSAKAAGLAGAGMVHVAVPDGIYESVSSQLTGEICVPIPDGGNGVFCRNSIEELKREIEWSNVVLIGPGLGRDTETLAIIREVINGVQKPTIIDADALSAFGFEDLKSYPNRHHWLFTPHHGEFSRISWFNPEQIEDNPLQFAQEFSRKSGVTLNLKNAPSLVTTPDGRAFINSTGNVALAKGGSGDVLAGIIAALVGQGKCITEAAWMGNFIHGLAADIYANEWGMHTLTPEIQLEMIPRVYKELL